MTTQEMCRPYVLATDLDGTLIPLDKNPDHQQDLQVLAGQLKESSSTLAYSTGRHLASVMDAIHLHRLPAPEWIICDVGSTIYRCELNTTSGLPNVELVSEYHDALQDILESMPLSELQERLQPLERSGTLERQEAEKQGRFKLSYYCRTSTDVCSSTVAKIRELLAAWRAPFWTIDSVDPFNGDGLIDFLPKGVSKAYALRWLAEHQQWPHESVVFAGDSGNDLAALSEGFLAIVVGNADRQVAREAESAHARAGWRRRLYLAEKGATSGVLEGCQWFDMF